MGNFFKKVGVGVCSTVLALQVGMPSAHAWSLCGNCGSSSPDNSTKVDKQKSHPDKKEWRGMLLTQDDETTNGRVIVRDPENQDKPSYLGAETVNNGWLGQKEVVAFDEATSRLYKARPVLMNKEDNQLLVFSQIFFNFTTPAISFMNALNYSRYVTGQNNAARDANRNAQNANAIAGWQVGAAMYNADSYSKYVGVWGDISKTFADGVKIGAFASDINISNVLSPSLSSSSSSSSISNVDHSGNSDNNIAITIGSPTSDASDVMSKENLAAYTLARRSTFTEQYVFAKARSAQMAKLEATA